MADWHPDILDRIDCLGRGSHGVHRDNIHAQSTRMCFKRSAWTDVLNASSQYRQKHILSGTTLSGSVGSSEPHQRKTRLLSNSSVVSPKGLRTNHAHTYARVIARIGMPVSYNKARSTYRVFSIVPVCFLRDQHDKHRHRHSFNCLGWHTEC